MKRNAYRILSTFALAASMTSLLSAEAHAETVRNWGIRALNIQTHIDDDAPLARTTWVGTHNSFANHSDDNLLDYNQFTSLKGQLDWGVREIVLDVHYWNDEVRVCHNNTQYEACVDGVTGNRQLAHALDDINGWIKADHLATVILLKLSLADSARHNINKVEQVLSSHIGSFIYRTDRNSSHGDLNASTGCTRLPASSLTKRTVLSAGKNIIVFTSESCISNGGFNDLTFYADTAVDDVNTHTEVSGATNKNSVMFRAKDAITSKGKLGNSPYNGGLMMPSTVGQWLSEGLNIFEMYGFGATDSSWNTGATSTGVPIETPVQPQHMVWSWKSTQPAGGVATYDCATIARQDGRLSTGPCEGINYRHACYNAGTGQWSLSATAGDFWAGFNACPSGSKFYVPYNALERDRLKAAMTQAGVDFAFVNYTDKVMEGHWIANSSNADYLTSRYWYKSDAKGGSGGSAFDDSEQLVLDLYRTKRQITKVEIAAGNRVDKVRLTYSDGRQVSWGSNDPSTSRTLPSDEYLTSAYVCVKSYNGSDRVFYLKFTTNKGNTISGGKQEGTCTTASSAGKELFAMHGRSGAAIDKLGFYFRTR